MIKFLSPTSIGLFHRDVEAFIRKYVFREPREAQTWPMAAGSAFDAFIKSCLYSCLIGQNAQFELEAIFEAQVDPHNRDWAREAGKHIFTEYEKAGCVQDLLVEMDGRIGDPKFEFRIEETIEGVPLLGLPDVYFTSKETAHVLYDWKINGYCSSRLKSPAKGYVRLRPGHKIHKDCHLLMWKGIQINAGMFLEQVDKSWADQLSIYSWLMGEEVGSTNVIFGIDQGCGPASKMRFASHRLRVTPEYQKNLFALIKQIWAQIQNDHYFLDLPVEESRERVKLMAARKGQWYDAPDSYFG